MYEDLSRKILKIHLSNCLQLEQLHTPLCLRLYVENICFTRETYADFSNWLYLHCIKSFYTTRHVIPSTKPFSNKSNEQTFVLLHRRTIKMRFFHFTVFTRFSETAANVKPRSTNIAEDHLSKLVRERTVYIIGIRIMEAYQFSSLCITLCSNNRSSRSDTWIQPANVPLIGR